MPAPMPVPTETKTTCACPRAAPNRTSAQALAFASFSTTTGSPMTFWTRRRSGSSRQARLGANRTLAPASSMNPAAPRPTARTWWRPSSSATVSAITCSVRAGLDEGVARRSFSTIFPCSSTTPAATLVPPTSTPIVRLIRRPFRGARRFGLLLRVLRRPIRHIRPDRGGRSLPGLGGGRPGRPSGGGQSRLEDGHRVLGERRHNVADGRHLRRHPGSRLPEHAGRPAYRAPRALGSLIGGRGGRFPYVGRPPAVPEHRAQLPADLAAHAARARADEPPLEIADRVLAGSARLLCHVLSPLPASARSLSPFSAVSMMVRSALRFSIPGIGIRTSTARS